jgi:uncharacterized protein (TIGR00725 family)
VPERVEQAGRYVAVVGPSEPEKPEWLEYARAVGAELAARRCVLVTGGGGGVMAEASEGAHRAGGIVLGLLKESDRAGANQWLTVAVPTGMGEARNALVVNSSDAVIAVGGNWGTLSEVALARVSNKPVACIDSWGIIRSDGSCTDDELYPVVARDPVSTAREAVATVLDAGSGGMPDGTGNAGRAAPEGTGGHFPQLATPPDP